MWNCWPKYLNSILKWVDYPWEKIFDSNCKKHDDGYTKGWREFDRWIEDIKLLKNNIKSVYKRHWLHRVRFMLWCLIYHILVMFFWPLSYNYRW